MDKKIKNFGIITQKDYIGKTKEEAIKIAENNGFTWRIVEENGVAYMVTMECRPDRINFRLNSDIVIDVYGG